MLRAGNSVAVAPQDQVIAVRYKGEWVLAQWQAFGDGYQGYVPTTATYSGEGHITSINPPKLVRGPHGPNDPNTNLAALNGVVGSDDPTVVLARSTGSIVSNHPQRPNPTPVNRAAELLARDDCGNFIAELISIAASLAQDGPLITPSFAPSRNLGGSPTPSYDQYYGLNAYRSAVSEGRVTASGNSGVNGNLLTVGETTNHRTISWNREFYSQNLDDAARSVIHESLHLIPNFRDVTLAGAASIIATRNRNSPGRARNFANQSDASQYLNEQITRYCH
jgi:hypothetical protein